jgi:hypothetical protein
MDQVMLGLFRPLEDCVGPSILTVGALPSVVFLGWVFKFSSESVCLPFLKRDTSTAMWVLQFYYLD